MAAASWLDQHAILIEPLQQLLGDVDALFPEQPLAHLGYKMTWYGCDVSWCFVRRPTVCDDDWS